MIRWKDEGPGGPVWISDVEIGEVGAGDLLTYTDVKICNDMGQPVWFTRYQAEALAGSLSLPFVET